MALLETHDLTARYGDFKALFGIDFAIEAGETVAINRLERRRQVDVPGAPCAACSPQARNPSAGRRADRRRLGPAEIDAPAAIAMAPEGRKLFAS